MIGQDLPKPDAPPECDMACAAGLHFDTVVHQERSNRQAGDPSFRGTRTVKLCTSELVSQVADAGGVLREWVRGLGGEVDLVEIGEQGHMGNGVRLNGPVEPGHTILRVPFAAAVSCVPLFGSLSPLHSVSLFGSQLSHICCDVIRTPHSTVPTADSLDSVPDSPSS